jgi:hypothetical protein
MLVYYKVYMLQLICHTSKFTNFLKISVNLQISCFTQEIYKFTENSRKFVNLLKKVARKFTNLLKHFDGPLQEVLFDKCTHILFLTEFDIQKPSDVLCTDNPNLIYHLCAFSQIIEMCEVSCHMTIHTITV